MSRNFTKNNKSLAGVKVVPAKDVWVFNKISKKKDKLSKDYELIGKVDTSMPNMILKANRKDKKTAYIDDVNSLSAVCKKQLVNHFFDDKGNKNLKTVAYLVRTDSQSQTKEDVIKKLKNKK